MLIGYFTFKIKNVFRACGNRVCLEAVKMTLWVVEATTESSEKMKSKRAVRWHDLDKGNMVGRKHLMAKRYKGIPVELELIMALRLTGPRFSRQQSQSAANCLCGILAASVCTPRESQNQERNTQNRSKQKPILLRIHFEKTRPQTNVYLSCAAGQHVTVKAETLNYPKKMKPAQGCTKSENLAQIFF